jgi:rRNA maturation endonuclease Nob1
MSNFVDLDNTSVSKAYASDLYDDSRPITKSTAFTYDRKFEGYDGPGRSIKSEYLRKDFEWFRQASARPTTRIDILKSCQTAYDKVGIVRQTIDLMSDFGAKGVRVRHENPSVERFMQRWWDTVVNGSHVSERFLNILYRLGTVPIYKTYGKINKSTQKKFKSVKGEVQQDVTIKLDKGLKNVIPTKYTFINPTLIDVFAKDLANFTGKNIYILKISSTITDINVPFSIRDKNQLLNSLKEQLPSDIRSAINARQDYIVLDQDRLSLFHYKKDDWQVWGKPIIYSILDDLVALEKLKLADISALDGAISNIRLWRVGRLTDDPKTTIIPTKSMLQKVESYLQNSVGGGTMDIVWGPELDFKESSTQVYKFLGKEKYEPTLDSIYMGLGIPSVLRSDKVVSGNNQFISMKTLLERLNYGRSLLKQFWEQEFIYIQKVMGFSKPAVLEFDQAIIADDAAEKQLLINLADRDIISQEFIREKFGANNEIEKNRINKEYGLRGEDSPYKASPFHNANIDQEYKKLLLQGGTVTPSEVGVELEEKDPNQKTKMDFQAEMVKTKNIQTGENGRPKNITETQKREPKQGDSYRISKSQLELVSWANDAQKYISETISPAILKGYGKKNIRSLSKIETEELEIIKASILFNMQPMEKLSNSSVKAALDAPFTMTKAIKEILSEDITVENKHTIFSLIYAEQNYENI